MAYYSVNGLGCACGIGAGEVAIVPASSTPPAPPQQQVTTLPGWAVGAILVGAVGVLGAFAYMRYRLTMEIVKKDGWKGALAYTAGEQAAGVLGHAAHSALDRS